MNIDLYWYWSGALGTSAYGIFIEAPDIDTARVISANYIHSPNKHPQYGGCKKETCEWYLEHLRRGRWTGHVAIAWDLGEEIYLKALAERAGVVEADWWRGPCLDAPSTFDQFLQELKNTLSTERIKVLRKSYIAGYIRAREGYCAVQKEYQTGGRFAIPPMPSICAEEPA